MKKILFTTLASTLLITCTAFAQEKDSQTYISTETLLSDTDTSFDGCKIEKNEIISNHETITYNCTPSNTEKEGFETDNKESNLRPACITVSVNLPDIIWNLHCRIDTTICDDSVSVRRVCSRDI